MDELAYWNDPRGTRDLEMEPLFVKCVEGQMSCQMLENNGSINIEYRMFE